MNQTLIKHKEEIIASARSVLDMLYNSKDLMDVKKFKNADINEETYGINMQNIQKLEEALNHFVSANDKFTTDDENNLIGALATTAVYLDYLSNCYKKAAEQAKIIVANLKTNI